MKILKIALSDRQVFFLKNWLSDAREAMSDCHMNDYFHEHYEEQFPEYSMEEIYALIGDGRDILKKIERQLG